MTYRDADKVLAEQVVKDAVAPGAVVKDSCTLPHGKDRETVKRLTLINSVNMRQTITIPPQDSVNVGLHHFQQLVLVGNVLHPLRQLRVPHKRMATDDGAGLCRLVKDLRLSYRPARSPSVLVTFTKSAPVQLKTPRSGCTTSHLSSFSCVYWSNCAFKIGSKRGSER